MGEIIAVIILEEEEDDHDLMVCCVREGVADILKTRKDDGY
jgi:hypothetical protein